MNYPEVSYTPADISDYRRVLPVRNPVSTNAAGWMDYLDDIRKNTNLAVAEPVESEKNPANTAQRLAENARDGDIVYLLGGDGLANNAAQYLGSAAAANVVTMFSPLGNACNAYHATIRTEGHDGRPSKILRSGGIESIFPLRGQVDNDTESYERLALSIISVGAIATGAAVLDEPKHRNNWLRRNPRTRLAYEYYLSFAITPFKTHILEMVGPDDDEPWRTLDVLAANAPQLAKVARFDTEITEPELLLGGLKNRLPWNLIRDIRRLQHGTLPAERIKRGQMAADFYLTHSRRNHYAMIEFDGEASQLTPGSRIRLDQPAEDDSRYQPIRTIIVR